MRSPAAKDKVLLALVAAACLAPAVWAFRGEGSCASVFGAPAAGSVVTPRELVFAALARSLAAGAGATVLALLVGIPAAWALSSRRRSPLLLATCALPLALPPSAAVSGWLYWFAPGDVSSAFQKLDLGMAGPSPLFSIPGVALVLGVGLWPIVAFEVWPAFRRARGEAYDAARLHGSAARAFLRIVLPSSAGELAAGALLVFLLAASDFTVSSLLLVRTLPIEVHDQLVVRRLGAAAWTALPWVLVAAAAALALARPAARGGMFTGETYPGGTSAGGSGGVFAVGWPAWAALGLGLGIGFGLPLAGCAAGAFAGGKPLGPALAAGWPALKVSLRLAAAVALLAMVLGATRVVLWPENPAGPLLWAGLLWLALPGSFLAGGLLVAEVQGRSWLDALGGAGREMGGMLPGSLALAAGYLLRFLYVPLRLAEEGLRGLDPALLEAAETAGHGRLSRGLGVALPLVWPHLLAAGGLIFVLALGELPLSDQLAPPGAVPLCVWLFNQQHNGYSEGVFGASLLAGVFAVVALAAVAAWAGRMRAREDDA